MIRRTANAHSTSDAHGTTDVRRTFNAHGTSDTRSTSAHDLERTTTMYGQRAGPELARERQTELLRQAEQWRRAEPAEWRRHRRRRGSAQAAADLRPAPRAV